MTMTMEEVYHHDDVGHTSLTEATSQLILKHSHRLCQHNSR